MDALLIKVPEAAAQLGISRAKLYELIGSGALPTVKVGGCRRVRTAAGTLPAVEAAGPDPPHPVPG